MDGKTKQYDPCAGFPAPKSPEFGHEDMTYIEDLTEEELEQVLSYIDEIKRRKKYGLKDQKRRQIMELSEKKRMALDEAERFFKNGLNIVKEIREGAAESKTCKKYGVDVSAFRNFLFKPNWGYKEGEPGKQISGQVKTGLLFNGYEQLFCILAYYKEAYGNRYYLEVESEEYGKDPENDSRLISAQITIPADCEERIKKAMSNLPEDEQKVLSARYLGERYYTLDEVGTKLGKNREWVRQKESSAFRALRRYENFLYIKYSPEEIEEELHRRGKYRKLQSEKLREERLEEIGRILDERDKELKKKTIKDISNMLSELRAIKKEMETELDGDNKRQKAKQARDKHVL